MSMVHQRNIIIAIVGFTLRSGTLKKTRWSIVLSDELPYDVFSIALENLFSGVKDYNEHTTIIL